MEVGSVANIIPSVTKAISQFYCPGFVAAQTRYNQGETTRAGIELAKQVNQVPLIEYKIKATKQAVDTLSNNWSAVRNKVHVLDKSISDPSKLRQLFNDSDMKGLFNAQMDLCEHGTKLTEFGFFKFTFAQHWLDKSQFGRFLVGLDKNLLDLKSVKNLFGTTFKNCEMQSAINAKTGMAEKFLVGTNGAAAGKSASLTAKTCGRIPVLSVVVSGLLELPNIFKAFKKGDGINQVGRSAINIAGWSLGAAALGALMSPLIPPFGSLLGAVLGSWIGGKVADKAGKFVFGEPIPDQKFPKQQNFFDLKKGYLA